MSVCFFFFLLFLGAVGRLCVCVCLMANVKRFCAWTLTSLIPRYLHVSEDNFALSLLCSLALSLFSSKRRIGFPQLLYQFRWQTKAKLGVCAIWQFRHVALGSTQSDVTSYTLVYSTAISHRSPVNKLSLPLWRPSKTKTSAVGVNLCVFNMTKERWKAVKTSCHLSRWQIETSKRHPASVASWFIQRNHYVWKAAISSRVCLDHWLRCLVCLPTSNILARSFP